MADEPPRPPLAAPRTRLCFVSVFHRQSRANFTKSDELNSVSVFSPLGFRTAAAVGRPQRMPWLGQGAADPGVAVEQHTAEAVKPQAMDRTSSGVKPCGHRLGPL